MSHVRRCRRTQSSRNPNFSTRHDYAITRLRVSVPVSPTPAPGSRTASWMMPCARPMTRNDLFLSPIYGLSFVSVEEFFHRLYASFLYVRICFYKEKDPMEIAIVFDLLVKKKRMRMKKGARKFDRLIFDRSEYSHRTFGKFFFFFFVKVYKMNGLQSKFILFNGQGSTSGIRYPISQKMRSRSEATFTRTRKIPIRIHS